MTRLRRSSLTLLVFIVISLFSIRDWSHVSIVHPGPSTMSQPSIPDLIQYGSSSTFYQFNQSAYITGLENRVPLDAPFVVQGSGGFNGTITLSADFPPGITFSITPSSLVLRPDNFGFSYGSYQLNLTGNSPGTYVVAITATNGTISNRTTITAVITDGPGFILVPVYPYSGRIGLPGEEEGYAGTIVFQAVMLWSTGFQGYVTLSTKVSPTGPNATLTMSTDIEQPGNPSAQTIYRFLDVYGKTYTLLDLNAPTAADYTVTVTASAGAQVESLAVVFRVTDFDLTVSPGSLSTLSTGATLQSRITVTSLNGFSDPVNFTISAPPGFSATLSSKTIKGAGAVTMNVTDESAPPGTYNITVNAMTRLYFTHIATFSIQVRAPFSILPYALPLTATGALASTGAAIYLRRRQQKRDLEREWKNPSLRVPRAGPTSPLQYGTILGSFL